MSAFAATAAPPPSSTATPLLDPHPQSLLPPPSLLEVLAAYAAHPQQDRSSLLALLAAKQAEDERLARAWKIRHEQVRRASAEATKELHAAVSSLGQLHQHTGDSAVGHVHLQGLASPALSEPVHLPTSTASDVGLCSMVGWSTERTLAPLSGCRSSYETSGALSSDSVNGPPSHHGLAGAIGIDAGSAASPPELQLSPASPLSRSSALRLPPLAAALRESTPLAYPAGGPSAARQQDPVAMPFVPGWSLTASTAARPIPFPADATEETLSSMPERRRAPALFPSMPAAPALSSPQAAPNVSPVVPTDWPSTGLRASLPSLASLLNESPPGGLPLSSGAYLPTLASADPTLTRSISNTESPENATRRVPPTPPWSLSQDPLRPRADDDVDGGREGWVSGGRPRIDPQ